MNNCVEITNCVCCKSDNLRIVLDLGNQSPVNNYNVTDKFPLRLNVCLDCSHAQLSHAVNPDILFKDYPYLSGVSKTMREYYREFAETARKVFPEAKTVFEIACNDGAQLSEFSNLGFETMGIDPAENIAKGPEIICGYFPQDAPNLTFDIIVAQNVFAHVADPYDFLEGCKKIMHKDSVLLIQTSQAKMLENHQFDALYAEHISFFNKRSISKLIARAGFEIIHHDFLSNIHGGSDLFTLRKLPEISIGDYSEFSNRCYKFAKEFREKVEKMKAEGHWIICYGAAAKMINLIRFTGIKPDVLIDDTPTKKGATIEGLFVNGGEVLESFGGGYIIPVWNFFDEIRNKVESAHPGKFQFLKYTPKIELC